MKWDPQPLHEDNDFYDENVSIESLQWDCMLKLGKYFIRRIRVGKIHYFVEIAYIYVLSIPLIRSLVTIAGSFES